MQNPINYAVIQLGTGCIGTGNTYRQAIEDAAEWCEKTESEILKAVRDPSGLFCVLTPGEAGFRTSLEYLGYQNIGGQWFVA